jgi:hypothetical protein
MTKRTFFFVVATAALLVLAAIAVGAHGDGTIHDWFLKIHGH